MLMALSLCFTQICCLTNWPALDEQMVTARRTERDIARPIPMDNVTTYGVNLNSQVFDIQGYRATALSDIGTMLTVGVQTFLLDLYWNEYTSKWQLCPGPIPNNATSALDSTTQFYWQGNELSCEPGMTIYQVMQQIHGFMALTNAVLEADALQLVVRLKSISYKQTNATDDIYDYSATPAYLNVGNSTLSDSVSPLGSFLFAPTDLNLYVELQKSNFFNTPYNETSMFPTLEIYMLNHAKRILVNVIEDDLTDSVRSYNTTATDNSTVFLPNTNITNTVDVNSQAVLEECKNAINGSVTIEYTDFNYILDSNDFPFNDTTFKDYLRCGYFPILSANTELLSGNTSISDKIDNYIPQGFWSWAVDQPIAADDMLDIVDETQNSTVAYRCVALYKDGFRVDNCYEEYPYACKNSEDLATWSVDRDDKKQYFDSYNDDVCQDGFEFSVPRLATDALLLIRTMAESNISFPIWIDLNDITFYDCFVTGGPYAQCPYYTVLDQSSLVKQLAPAFSICGLIVVLVFIEKFFRINPIQTNRKTYWKRVINEYNEKHDFEGVPS